MSKINVENTMKEIVSLQNQINGLQMLLSNKKKIISKYFDYTGEKNVSNDECTVFVQERVNIKYFLDRLKDKLDSKTFDFIVDKNYVISDWSEFKKLMKKYEITTEEIRKVIKIDKKINEDSIKKLYESGEISIKDLEGCYEAKVSKSIVLRMKNVDKEIPVSNK